jgi:hypothetical protein
MSATPKQDSSTAPDPTAPAKAAPTAAAPAPATIPSADSEWIEVIRQHVASLRFGVIQVVIHEGRVVQIERTEKYRLNPKAGSQP